MNDTTQAKLDRLDEINARLDEIEACSPEETPLRREQKELRDQLDAISVAW